MTGFTTRRRTDAIVIHCSATKPGMDIGAKEIREWHLQRQFRDIGYHYVIRRDGTVETGRPQDVVGSHVQGHNSASVGVCMVGGLDAAGNPAPEYTDKQWKALELLILKLQHDYPNATVKGHRDFPGVAKACPSFDVSRWLKETFA